VIRVAVQPIWPSAISRGWRGVACIAWKRFVQTKPAMIGNVASNDAVCMTAAARRPGARNAR